MKPTIFVLVFVSLLWFLTISGCASTNTRLVTLNQSYHYDRSKPFNESHNGVGVGWLFDKENHWSMGYISFKNSHYCCGRDRSNMLFATREWNPVGDLHIGLSWFAGDGYGKEQEDILWLGGVTFRYEFDPAISIYTIITPVVAVDGLMLQYQDGEQNE